MAMVTQTPAFVIPRDWFEVMEDERTRSAEHLIARTFTACDQHHTCIGPVATDEGVIWACEWCGAIFTSPYHGAHARNTPHYLSDLSASLALIDDLRRRDPTLEVEIQLYPREGDKNRFAQTRIHVERYWRDDKQAELNRFVSSNEYTDRKRSPLCVALFEALFELYEFCFLQESETRR